MTTTQVETKFVREQEKYSLTEKKKLGELDKNLTPHPCFSDHPHLINFAVFSTKDQLLSFIFNNYSSFANLSLHLILCADGVYICNTEKTRVPCHTVADKLLGEWLPRELW